MNFIKQIERIKKVHNLISMEKTGTPYAFAQKLNLSRSQLYNILGNFKELGAILKYCKKRESFYYENYFDLELNYSLKIMVDEENMEVFGGFDFRPILLDGTLFTLI
jgi:predicted transcriptional regulator